MLESMVGDHHINSAFWYLAHISVALNATHLRCFTCMRIDLNAYLASSWYGCENLATSATKIEHSVGLVYDRCELGRMNTCHLGQREIESSFLIKSAPFTCIVITESIPHTAIVVLTSARFYARHINPPLWLDVLKARVTVSAARF